MPKPKSLSRLIEIDVAVNSKKWNSSIQINGKNKNLGCFIDEHEAHLVYQNALKNIEL